MKTKLQILGVVIGMVVITAMSVVGLTKAQSTQRQVTLLSSSLRTATTTSADQFNIGENLNVRGVLITLDVTAVLTTPTATLSVQGKDPASGKYENLLTASGVTAQGTHSYLVYPGVGAASADVTKVAGFVLPNTWRVSVAHSDTDPITYTVGAMLLP